MSQLNSLIDSIPVGRIAQQFGIDEAQARAAIESILPSLVGGMQANAQDPRGAASLESALNQHASQVRLAEGSFDPAEIDTADGEKIANHIFGANQGAVTDKLAAASGADKSLIEKLIPVIAPIAMAWLASKLFGGRAQHDTEPAEFDRASEAPRVPGSTGQDRVVEPGESGLGDLLGGLLGGGAGSSQAGGLGDLLGGLGGLLGGGRR